MKLKLVEPLRELFKDEVRELGAELGLPRHVLWRQPFPGPGPRGALPRRGDRAAAATCCARPTRSSTRRSAPPGSTSRSGRPSACCCRCKSVGVMGDERTYATTLCVRAVHSQGRHDRRLGAAAVRAARHASAARIINEVRGINRVVYDITSQAAGDDRVGVSALLVVVAAGARRSADRRDATTPRRTAGRGARRGGGRSARARRRRWRASRPSGRARAQAEKKLARGAGRARAGRRRHRRFVQARSSRPPSRTSGSAPTARSSSS